MIRQTDNDPDGEFLFGGYSSVSDALDAALGTLAKPGLRRVK